MNLLKGDFGLKKTSDHFQYRAVSGPLPSSFHEVLPIKKYNNSLPFWEGALDKKIKWMNLFSQKNIDAFDQKKLYYILMLEKALSPSLGPA